MLKETSITMKICDWVIKYSIYALIFLVPIFFLPWTSDVLDFNKQFLLVLLGFTALFAWMLRALTYGKFELNISKVHVIIGVLFLIYFLSTIFSVNRYGSFWGWPQPSSESFLTVISLFSVYFLVSNYFSKKDIFISAIILSFSVFLAQIFGFFQLLSIFIIPFDFAKSISFNTMGSVGSLGFITAILLPLFIVFLITSKKWLKVLFAAEILLSAVILIIINYPMVWWVAILGSATIMISGLLKKNLFNGRWMVLPMFFLVISLFFVLLNPQIPRISKGVSEIFLSNQATIQIAMQAVRENPILGSGLGTFSYDFLKFKDPSLSNSSLWSVVFYYGSSEILTILSTAGILGFITMLALIIMPLFYGIKFFIGEKIFKQDIPIRKETLDDYWILILGLYSVLAAAAITFFLYNFNITLYFIFFLALSCLVGMISLEKREYELKPSSLLTLAVTFVFTLVFIFGLGLIILDGQRYVAEINHYKGQLSGQAGQIDETTKRIELATSLNPSSDLYFRELSQIYLSNLQNELNNIKETPTEDQKNKIQALVANSVNASKIATDLNPKSSSAWANRGYIYQNLTGFISDAGIWAVSSYDEALKLDPNNLYLLSQQGALKFVEAKLLGQDKNEEKSQLLAQAKEKLEKAKSLNPNYSNALYFLGLVYDALGQKSKAIEEFTKVKELDPENTDIPKILSNLKAGLPALQQTPEITTSPPEEETPDSIKTDSEKK